MYKILVEAGIAVPHHIVVNRDGLEPGEDPPGFVQEVRGGTRVVVGTEWLGTQAVGGGAGWGAATIPHIGQQGRTGTKAGSSRLCAGGAVCLGAFCTTQ